MGPGKRLAQDRGELRAPGEDRKVAPLFRERAVDVERTGVHDRLSLEWPWPVGYGLIEPSGGEGEVPECVNETLPLVGLAGHIYWICCVQWPVLLPRLRQQMLDGEPVKVVNHLLGPGRLDV